MNVLRCSDMFSRCSQYVLGTFPECSLDIFTLVGLVSLVGLVGLMMSQLGFVGWSGYCWVFPGFFLGFRVFFGFPGFFFGFPGFLGFRLAKSTE